MDHACIWFRNNLRIKDNPALSRASQHAMCYPIYILNEHNIRPIGEASMVWLYYALKDLNTQTNENLTLLKGDYLKTLSMFIKAHKIHHLYFEKTYDIIHDINEDMLISSLQNLNCNIHVLDSRTLWNLNTVLKQDESPYKVFTPFYKRGCLATLPKQYKTQAPNITQLKKSQDSLTINKEFSIQNNQWANCFIC